MSSLHVRPLGFALGAQIEGLDISQPLAPAVVAELKAAWLDHIVLCFRGQELDQAALIAFGRNFGELDANDLDARKRHPEYPEITVVANSPVVMSGRKVSGLNDFRAAAGGHWHSDRTFKEAPEIGTFLMSLELPELGGNTLFANTYLAYETLSPAMHALIEPLHAIHDFASAFTSFAGKPPEEQKRIRETYPPVVQKLVRTHPDTGRKSLYLGFARTKQFVGMTEEESAPILAFLNAHAVRYEFTYRHRWALGDLVMWDNRCAIHSIVNDFDQSVSRRLIKVNTKGPKVGTLLRDFEGAEKVGVR